MGTVPTLINDSSEITWGMNNNYTASNFVAMYGAGIVFLPAAGYCNGSSVAGIGTAGFYWSSTGGNSDSARYLLFNHKNVAPSNHYSRFYGRSVRLVREI